MARINCQSSPLYLSPLYELVTRLPSYLEFYKYVLASEKGTFETNRNRKLVEEEKS